MSDEPGGPAVSNLLTTQGGRDEMIKASISLQDLRKKIYLKAKSEKTWRLQGKSVASAGTGGVETGLTRLENAASPIGHINLWVKRTGKPGAGNWHAGFDEARTGNVLIILTHFRISMTAISPVGERTTSVSGML
jgi:hypothetical protein